MSEAPQYLVVVLDRYGRIKAKHGPMPKEQAVLLRAALKAKSPKQSVQVRKDRTGYFATYHANRYKNDPAYRERQLKAANEWNRKARAAAKGDITPWLE